MSARLAIAICLGFSLSACSFASKYNAAEQEMADSLTPSKYQPATRELRDNIDTQEVFAQAAFWSHEYQLNPGDLEAAIKLAAAVRKMGNPEKAIEITQTSRALYPKDPYLAAEYTAALIAAERGSEAIKPLDTALRTAPGYARLWSLKGAALDQEEQYDLARKHYGRALQITPHDPNIMANMGLSYALSGDSHTAETWLRRAASIPGAGASVKQNLDLILQLQGKTSKVQKSAELNTPALRTTPTSQTSRVPRSTGIPTPTGYPAPTNGNFGYRSNVNVVGNTAGAPKTASEAARAAASQSAGRPPIQRPVRNVQQQGNILEHISKSLRPRTATQPQIAQRQQGYYPAPQTARQPQTLAQRPTATAATAQPRGAARSRY